MKKLLKRCLSAFLFVGMVTGAGLLSSCGGSKASTSAAPSTNVSTSTSTSAEDTNQLEFVGAPEYIYVEGTTDLSVKCDGRNVSATITFTSSDETIATVSSSGRVTGVSAGEVTITAAADGYLSATHTLTVRSMTQDITISITPAFTSGSLHQSVQDGYGIFFASALNWSTAIPATLNTDAGTWDVTLEDVEFDQTISYNTYYAKTTGQGWDYMNTEPNGGSRSLAIVEGTLNYPITSTFEVPKTVESVEYIITLSIGDGETINDGVYVYVSTDTNQWATTAKATLNEEDGTYHYTETNVDIGWEHYRICLGYESGLSWSYQYPVASDTTNYFEVTDTTTSFTVAATFATQPAAVDPDAEEHSVTFGLLCSDSNASNTQVVYDATTEPNGNWETMTQVADGEFTFTTSLTDGTYYFFFYTWTTDNLRMYADTDSTAFSVTVDGADVVIGVRGTFADGTGSIVDNYVPTTPSATYAVTFTLKLTDALPESGSTTNTNLILDGDWTVMTFDGTDTFTCTKNFADGEYWFCFCTWGTDENRMYASESDAWFSFTVSGAAMSIVINGSFNTGVGTIQA